MGFRFFRRIKVAPGVTVNLSKSGGSLSVGPRGAKMTVGPRGVRKTLGIPGTGLYHTTHTGYGAKRSASRSSRRATSTAARKTGSRSQPTASSTTGPAERLSLGFFQRLTIPRREAHFVDGMRQFISSREAAALEHFSQALHIADAAWMAGILSLKRRDYPVAERAFQAARDKQKTLGTYFRKYQVAATVQLAITDHVTALVSADLRGVLLAMAETFQHQGRWKEAVVVLRQLYRQDPDDLVVRLSLAELAVEESSSRRAWQTAVELAEGIENQSEIHAAILLYKGAALRRLDLLTPARDTLTAALRRTADRSRELLQAIRYERALVYQAMGQQRRAREDFGILYAESPNYEDVADRLGLER
jgi:tetratricopeptide (TPR) repeat protein